MCGGDEHAADGGVAHVEERLQIIGYIYIYVCSLEGCCSRMAGDQCSLQDSERGPNVAAEREV